ncbi:general substrate transporter [Butyriboletus roseoflavus]|nr:general substrate transporter [Butyriboletus roseoflavus]
MATTTEHSTEKIDDITSIDKGTPHGNLTFLAQVAATDHALTPLEAMHTHWRAFLWCLFMCIGALLWGYDAQVGGGLLSVPQFRTDFGYIYQGQPVLPASWQSAFNSVSSIGGMFGGLSLGWISDKLGRRGAVAVACAISIVGVFIQFFSPTHANAMLLVGKLINGFALGMYVSCAGGYCAEVSPLALRGITTAGVNLWIVYVIINSMSNGVIRGTGNWTNAYAYRLPFALQWIFPVILLIGLPFAPESPWWLVRRGRFEDAERVLARLGGPTVDAKLQRQQIKETIELEDSYAATSMYADCFRGENLKRTIVAMMVFVLQQAAGVVFVLGFSTYFFELAGFATDNAFNLGVGVTAIGVVGNLVAFYAVNRFGRRFLFNWGMVGCTVILVLIGFIWIGNANPSAKWAVSAFTIIYNFVYQVGIGPLGYVIFAEVSSSKLRSKTVGIGIWTNSLCGMIANIVIPYLVNPDQANLGGYVGFIFGGLAFAGTIWSYFFIPETKGRTVDELDLLYEKRVPARHFGTYRLYDSDVDNL